MREDELGCEYGQGGRGKGCNSKQDIIEKCKEKLWRRWEKGKERSIQRMGVKESYKRKVVVM